MAVEFVLFGKRTREIIRLGERSDNSFGYRGPLVFFGGETYCLPDELLDLLRRRFRESNEGDIVIEPEHVLFESNEYILDEDEDCPILGGDQDNDPPFEKYLPELRNPKTRSGIIQDKRLKLS